MYKDRWIVGYPLQLKHCYSNTWDPTEAFGYNVVNNNKIWNPDYPKEHIENLEAQRKMDIKADLWFPTVVWNYSKLKQINNAELRDYVINFRQEDPQDGIPTMVGGKVGT